MALGENAKRVVASLLIAAFAAISTYAVFQLFPFLATAERWTIDFRIANLSLQDFRTPKWRNFLLGRCLHDVTEVETVQVVGL